MYLRSLHAFHCSLILVVSTPEVKLLSIDATQQCVNTFRFNLVQYNSIQFHSISCHDPGSVCHLVLAMRSKVSLELWASLNAFSVTTEKGERCSRVQRSAVQCIIE